ncbi:hypothetical protein Poly24_00770 [Rosistilla carotiformis]|uniref:Uncharacterized protein n=1 Tax=Rosistilla carotiformis TaxID=2528017 RepID=A0A518JLH2_9BACT|nr:hypothetical protein Poly24_00770 [Rosistilla carotiformis]
MEEQQNGEGSGEGQMSEMRLPVGHIAGMGFMVPSPSLWSQADDEDGIDTA